MPAICLADCDSSFFINSGINSRLAVCVIQTIASIFKFAREYEGYFAGQDDPVLGAAHGQVAARQLDGDIPPGVAQAVFHGGGGHRAASGCSIRGMTQEEAKRAIVRAAMEVAGDA